MTAAAHAIWVSVGLFGDAAIVVQCPNGQVANADCAVFTVGESCSCDPADCDECADDRHDECDRHFSIDVLGGPPCRYERMLADDGSFLRGVNHYHEETGDLIFQRGYTWPTSPPLLADVVWEEHPTLVPHSEVST